MSRNPSIIYSDWSMVAAKHWEPRMVTVKAGHWARRELREKQALTTMNAEHGRYSLLVPAEGLDVGDEGELLGTDVGRALVGLTLGAVEMRYDGSGRGVCG